MLPIRQDGTLGNLTLAYGVTPEFSFGLVRCYLDTQITPAFPGLPPLPPRFANALRLEILSLGLTADWDSRNDSDYPTSGFLISTTLTRGLVLRGMAQDYAHGTLAANSYHS